MRQSDNNRPLILSDFKVGQVVKYKGTSILAAEIGAMAIVKSVRLMYIELIWIRNKLFHNQSNGGYIPKDFDIISMAPKKKLKFLHKNKLISNLEYLEALSEK